jgi:hypothetical protein
MYPFMTDCNEESLPRYQRTKLETMLRERTLTRNVPLRNSISIIQHLSLGGICLRERVQFTRKEWSEAARDGNKCCFKIWKVSKKKGVASSPGEYR